MASDWKPTTIGEHFDLINGYAFKSRDFLPEGIPVIKIKNVKAGYFSEHEFSYVDLGFLKSRSDKVAKREDLLISMSGNRHDGSPSTWVGKIAFFDKTEPYLINQRVGALRLKPESDMHRRFMAYLLSSWQYQELFISIATSSGGQANISPRQILGAPFQAPPPIEQRAIAHILGTLDDKIELNRQMNRTLERMAAAIFKSWFIDFDPVHAKAENRDPGLPNEIADLFPDSFEESELGPIPKGWEVKPLPEVIDFKEGPGIRNWQYTNSDEGTRFINIRCIKDGDLKLETANRISDEEAYGKYAHFQLQEDDLVVSTSGTLGRFAIVRPEHLPLILNTSVIRMRPILPFCTLPYLIGYVGTGLQLELETRASGSVQRNFGPMHLKQISMLVPQLQILEAHNGITEAWLRMSQHLRQEADHLARLRDTLLPKLISGELPIRDASDFIGGEL